jgi:hypothetical protein
MPPAVARVLAGSTTGARAAVRVRSPLAKAVVPCWTKVPSVNWTKNQVRSMSWPVESRSKVRVLPPVSLPRTIFWEMFVSVPESDS